MTTPAAVAALDMVRVLLREHLERHPRVRAVWGSDVSFRRACDAGELAMGAMVEVMLARGADPTTVRLTVRDALVLMMTDDGLAEWERECDPVVVLGSMLRAEAGPIVYRRTTP